MTQPIPLQQAVDAGRFGGKCVSLGNALRAGLPTPGGFALDVETVNLIASGDTDSCQVVTAVFDSLSPALAVRSSAVGEDSEEASFAGQHATVLNVMSVDAMLAAIREVYQSAHTPQALAYREKLGIHGAPAIAIALQKQIASEISGVMFTRNPITNDPEYYIEASWGLGEAIVSGLVVPDSFRISRMGEIIERGAGEKDVMLIASPEGQALEVEVEGDKVETLCLNDGQLTQLQELAEKCEATYGPGLDIEWAFYQDKLYLLQCRQITA